MVVARGRASFELEFVRGKVADANGGKLRRIPKHEYPDFPL